MDCEILLIVDGTASMAPYLRPLASCLTTLDAGLATDPRLLVSYGVWPFRDIDLPAPSPMDFSGEASPGVEYLSSLEAIGGSDVAEPVGDAVAKAVSMASWSKDALRVAFVFTDSAPRSMELEEEKRRAREATAAFGAKVHWIAMGNPPGEVISALSNLSADTGGCLLSARLAGETAKSWDDSFIESGLDSTLRRIILAEAGAARGGSSSLDPAVFLLRELESRMAALKTYPEAARIRGISGSVALSLLVEANGDLRKGIVRESSGSAILDRAALGLARSVFPLEGLAEETLELSVVVTYRLER